MEKTKTERIDTKTTKAATPTVEKPAKKPSAEDVITVMQRLAKNGIREFHSRLISDKLQMEPDRGRQRVRNLMKKLEAKGKVIIEQKAVKEKGARKRYVYRLKESK
jgi:predicted transcriptional regulator